MENIKIITEHWGKIDPLKIEDYLAVGGYEALKKAIKMESEDIISEIKKSELCGRGGAGFSTGEKLAAVAGQKKDIKFFICNLDESEPGTYKDRAIADNNPHLLLEGIIIASLAIGAKKAFIYINGGYRKQREILEQAITSAKEKKYLGDNILESKHCLEVEIFSGAGSYVCGEETALINSMEGNRGEPKAKPPYPVEQGLYGYPTVINNAETIANIPWIIENGGEKFREIGSQCSSGTKLFILGGAVKNAGIFELPTGTSLKKIIFEIGGGMPVGKKFWFAQVGGACGGLILEKELNIDLDFGKSCSFPVGSGSILVVDRSADIFELLLSWSGFFRRESCGKCVPCREGTFRMHEIIKRFSDGEISERDRRALKDILWTLKNTTFCPFGKFAATAISDAMEKFDVV